MFKDDYCNELEKLTASEKFKQDTISLMQKKREELQQDNTNTIKFKTKSYRKIAASVAVTIFALGAMAYASIDGDLFIGPDSAVESEKSNFLIKQDEDYEHDSYDGVGASPPMSNPANQRVYTINDTAEIKSADYKTKDKIFFSTDNQGGMGYEAVMYYDISEMTTNNPFSINDKIDTLAVYQYNEADYNQCYAEIISVLDRLGKTLEDVTAVECSWSNISGSTTTHSFSPPHQDARLYSMNVKFNGGEININPSGIISVVSFADVPDYSTNDELIKYIIENYSTFIGNNTRVYCYNDYTYYGEQLYNNHFYSSSTNYSDNLLSYSVYDSVFYHFEDYQYQTEEKEEAISFSYLNKDAYTFYENLPAITYNEALGLLYSGEYHTTVPYAIEENSVVSKIELVYKEPPRNYQTMVKEGWAVPFYKFYVRLPNESATEKGILKHYGVYYVCAIHPDYIELTDEYIQFNGAY